MTVSASLAREILGRKTLSELLDHWQRRAEYPVEVRFVVRDLLQERGATVPDAAELDAGVPEVAVPEVAVPERQPVSEVEPWLLTLPIARFIGLSFLTFSLFDAYWMYKNWQVLQRRDRLDIWPLWRAVFGVFFCYGLFHRIHADRYGRDAVMPEFSPGRLATAWIVLVLAGNAVARFPGLWPLVIASIMPGYLCFVPVQAHINRVYAVTSPDRRFDNWSRAQVAAAVGGLLLWLLVLTPAG
ncbi:MAG: hypothetical protein ABI211_14030 [Vicinamibacterales bacterium]